MHPLSQMISLENYQQLDPLSRGLLFRQVKEKERISYQEIARRIKRSPAYVVNSVRLLDLPEAIKDGLIGGLITEGHARALISIRDPKKSIEIYKEILKTHASVRKTEELVRKIIRQQPSLFDQAKIKQLKRFLEQLLKRKINQFDLREARRGFSLYASWKS